MTGDTVPTVTPRGGRQGLLGATSGLPATVEAVISSLVAVRGLRSATLANRTMRMRWFASFLEAQGMEHLDQVTSGVVRTFIDSRRASGATVRLSEQHSRLAGVRLLYKEARSLGLASSDPALDVKLPRRSPTHARPLSDAEVEVCEVQAVRPGDTRPAVCLALAEATARTSEIPHIRVSDLELEAGTVVLHGGATTDPRLGRLTGWGITQLRRRLVSIAPSEGPDPILMGEGRWDDPDEGRAAATMVLVGILRSARLSAPGVNPRSIPAWAGAKALAEGVTIDAVARLLGAGSLDQAATIVGFEWREARAP